MATIPRQRHRHGRSAPARSLRVSRQGLRPSQSQEPGRYERRWTQHAYTRSIYQDPHGHAIMEKWIVHRMGHAWSGGSPSGSHTDPQGPNASAAMVRFFSEHPQEWFQPLRDTA